MKRPVSRSGSDVKTEQKSHTSTDLRISLQGGAERFRLQRQESLRPERLVVEPKEGESGFGGAQ